MKRRNLKATSSALASFLAAILLCSCADRAVALSLPLVETPINPDAGHGGLLVVTLKLESGEELPFWLDTGTSGTFFDSSLEPKLGKPLGTTVSQSWGAIKTNNVYAAPKLYLGGVRLKMSDAVVSDDFTRLSSAAGRPIMGILGFDCLRHYCVQLDFAAGKMRFLDGKHADKRTWGQAFPIVPLNADDARPSIAENLFGAHGPHSLIDTGFDGDGWLMPKYFRQWTNRTVLPASGEARSPIGLLGGVSYPLVWLRVEDVESDGIGLRFLARHLVTLDFPKHTLYLKRQSLTPLPDLRRKTTPMPALDPIVADVAKGDSNAARVDLVNLEQSGATALEKTVARKLAGTLASGRNLSPAETPSEVLNLPLGDARPEAAEVGWLEPAANRVPPNEEIESPLLDSGRIYATGLFAHAPSRYVYDLGGKWNTLTGEAGLHTAFQAGAFGVVFVITADGKEAFRSPTIRGSTHTHYDLDLTNVKILELRVEKAFDRNGGNWALWLDPTLSR